MQGFENPYAAPSAIVARPEEWRVLEKASRMSRLGAAIIDGILYAVCWVPAYVPIVMASSGPAGSDPGVLGILVSCIAGLALLALFGYNLWLLHTQGQTVAKRWLGIRIVRTDGSRAGLARLFWLRAFLPALLGAIPCLGTIFSLVDALMIFGEDKRCLHDQMADTIVVCA